MITDITFCPNTDCPAAEKCGRSTVRIHNLQITRPLSFYQFAPDGKSGKCANFLELRLNHRKDKIK